MRSLLRAPFAVDTALGATAVRERLARSIAAADGGARAAVVVTGRMEGDHVVLQPASPRPDPAGAALRGRVEARPEGGARLIGAVGPHAGLIGLLLLAVGIAVAGVVTRSPVIAALGLVGVVLAWLVARRDAARTARTLHALLEPLLQAPAARPRAG